MIKVIRIIPETVVDGLGVRTSIYLAGCNHNCKGCHNKESWDPDPKEYEKVLSDVYCKTLAEDINNNAILTGLTITGGDPLYNSEELLGKLKLIRSYLNTDKDIWLYTGFKFEDILKDSVKKEIASIVDVIVDGRFDIDKKDPGLAFRGSSNQRMILSKESIDSNTLTILEV